MLCAYSCAYTPDTVTICINGTNYIYRGNCSGIKLKNTFDNIAKKSEGKAVKWIKENAICIDKYIDSDIYGG